ncbi:hypothetical protein KC799_25185, partial [candidate division KSB1 bacterium]|nr:hypothetical protein [candidate division KSB1 bacterium]
MRWITNIREVFSVKLLFLAAALWVLGVGSLYIVLIEPQVATTEKIREELAELNNTRFLIRTTK